MTTNTKVLDYASLSESDRRVVRHRLGERILNELRLKHTESQVDSVLIALEAILEDGY